MFSPLFVVVAFVVLALVGAVAYFGYRIISGASRKERKTQEALARVAKVKEFSAQVDARFNAPTLRDPIRADAPEFYYPDANGNYNRCAPVLRFKGDMAIMHCGHFNHSSFPKPADQLRLNRSM